MTSTSRPHRAREGRRRGTTTRRTTTSPIDARESGDAGVDDGDASGERATRGSRDDDDGVDEDEDARARDENEDDDDDAREGDR